MSYRTAKNAAQQSGFTLVELAVVLLISSIIAAASFTLGTAWIEAEEYNAAKRQMTAIENAFETYRRMNLRLPCPASPTPSAPELLGFEGGDGPGDCTNATADTATKITDTVHGALPVKALGLPVSLMRDPWGQFYRYYVDERATAEGAFDIVNRGPLAGNNPGLRESTYIDPNCSNGNGAMYDEDTGACSAVPTNVVGEITVYGSGGSTRTDRAMFVLLSHGKNSYGGINRNGAVVTSGNPNPGNDELTNADPSLLALVQRLRDFTAGANYFDDLVLYKNRWHFREDVRPGETVGE